MRDYVRLRELLAIVVLLLLALFLSWNGLHAQTIMTGGNRRVSTAYENPCALPFSDSFSGTGALSACWATYTVALQAGGVATPNTSNEIGFAVLTLTSAPASQSAIVSVNWLSNPARSGPMVRANAASGNGYRWEVGSGQLNAVTSGVTVLATIGTCPAVNPGDTFQLSISGSTLTCTDLTTWAGASFTDSANIYPSGNPGFTIDGTSETDVGASNFAATSP
jgi:hypothetical protein